MEKYSKLRLIYPFLVHVGGCRGDADFSLLEISPLTLCNLERLGFLNLYSSSLVLDAANGTIGLLAIKSSLRLFQLHLSRLNYHSCLLQIKLGVGRVDLPSPSPLTWLLSLCRFLLDSLPVAASVFSENGFPGSIFH